MARSRQLAQDGSRKMARARWLAQDGSRDRARCIARWLEISRNITRARDMERISARTSARMQPMDHMSTAES
eukprot:417968-Pleurochrysis_carterae.AAC.2